MFDVPEVRYADTGEGAIAYLGPWHLYAAREREDVIVDLRQPRGLHAGDQVSVFLARRAPVTGRAGLPA